MIDFLLHLRRQILNDLRVLSKSKDGMSVVVGSRRKWSYGIETGRLRRTKIDPSGTFTVSSKRPMPIVPRVQQGWNPLPQEAVISYLFGKR